MDALLPSGGLERASAPFELVFDAMEWTNPTLQLAARKAGFGASSAYRTPMKDNPPRRLDTSKNFASSVVF
jgi:hypothetical protein